MGIDKLFSSLQEETDRMANAVDKVFDDTDRAGLRDIETTLNLCGDLDRSGLKVMPRFTLAEPNEKKDWRIYQDFAMTLVKEATELYKDEKLRIGLEEMIYAFDSSIIELCLKLCP